MSLVSRLTIPAQGEAKLPVHQFMAILAELKRAAPSVTVAAIAAHPVFNLSVDETTELTSFVANLYGDLVTREQIHDVLMLGEAGVYTQQQVIDRLLTPSGGSNILPLLVQRQLQVVNRGMNDCVLSGCVVSPQGSPDMTLAVTKGAVMSNGVLKPVTAGNVTITAAHATLPRLDMVVVDSAGAKQVRAGTPASIPDVAALQANDVCLAYVYVKQTDTAISSSEMLDGRVLSTNGSVTIGKITSPVTFNNTSAAQTYISLTIPAGLFAAGKVIRVSSGGNMLMNSGAPTVTLRISYGATLMHQSTTAAMTSDADRLAWRLDFELTAQAINDQALDGIFCTSPVGAKTAPTAGLGNIAVAGVASPVWGSAAVDSDAADRILLVQFTMSVQNALDEIVMERATGELV